MTETGVSLGTPHYMAPEQAMGEREITPKADVYALGCVLYEMLLGEPPFSGPTAQAIVAQVLTQQVPPIRSRRETVAPELEDAIVRAVQRLPADRFATAQEFAEALAQAAAAPARRNGGVIGAPGRGAARSAWWSDAHRPLTLGLAAATAVLAVALASTLASRSRAAAGSDRAAVIRFPVAVPNELANLGEPLLTAATVALSPDGRTLAFLASLAPEL